MLPRFLLTVGSARSSEPARSLFGRCLTARGLWLSAQAQTSSLHGGGLCSEHPPPHASNYAGSLRAKCTNSLQTIFLGASEEDVALFLRKTKAKAQKRQALFPSAAVGLEKPL